MSYDDTSLYGDMMCLEYIEPSIMNPPSPFGFFLYHVVGGTFDSMDTLCSDFRNDSSVLTCRDELVNWYGRNLGIPNPYINNTRYLTLEEYRVYIYLKRCRLLTVEDLQVCFNNCMGLDDYEVRIVKEEVDVLSTVDHLNYESNGDWTVSNLQAQETDETGDIITDYATDEDYNKLRGRKGHSYNLQVIIEIPSQDWDSDFLNLLMTFISVKGNVIIKEYNL